MFLFFSASYLSADENIELVDTNLRILVEKMLQTYAPQQKRTPQIAANQIRQTQLTKIQGTCIATSLLIYHYIITEMLFFSRVDLSTSI